MSQVRPMIRNLANYTSQLAQETEGKLNELIQVTNNQSKAIAALIRIIGEEQVQEAIKAIAQEEINKRQALEDAATKRLIDAGALTPIEAVTNKCLLVGTDKLADGTTRRIRTETERLTPDALNLFLGKKVGETVVNNNVTFTVNEIYAIDDAKMKEVIEAAQPKPPEAPVPPPPEAAVAPEAPKGKKNPRVKKGN